MISFYEMVDDYLNRPYFMTAIGKGCNSANKCFNIYNSSIKEGMTALSVSGVVENVYSKLDMNNLADIVCAILDRRVVEYSIQYKNLGLGNKGGFYEILVKK